MQLKLPKFLRLYISAVKITRSIGLKAPWFMPKTRIELFLEKMMGMTLKEFFSKEVLIKKSK
jgi:hypothetical protein